MFRKLIIAILLTSPIFAKTFNLEALYGYGYESTPTEFGKLKGSSHSGALRAIFFTENFAHEVLGRYTFSPSAKIDNEKAKYNTWEAEYRFGYRMDNDMAKLGMLSGSAYLGLGYQSWTLKDTISNDKYTTNYIYLPFGFWGEDAIGESGFKTRYGLNFKAMLFDDSTDKFKWDFLLGGKVYAGVGYSFGGVMDIFAQAFFTYNTPIKNLKMYGVEAGIQF